MKGLVVKKQSTTFVVDVGNELISCFSRGKNKENGIFVGDVVEVNVKEKNITKLYERKNKLIRPPLANLDNLLILVTSSPNPDFLLLDKLLIFCAVNGIKPIICHSKSDLGSGYCEYVDKVYGKFYNTVVFSSLQGKGLEQIKNKIKGTTSAVAGQSGVGKSALLNALLGEQIAVVGELSEKIERGKNTTRHTQLYKLAPNTYLADTAGFSALEEKFLPISAEELPYYYPDFIAQLPDCKFSSCSHTVEPDCAVIKCVESGEIDKARYERYLQIFAGLKEKRY